MIEGWISENAESLMQPMAPLAFSRLTEVLQAIEVDSGRRFQPIEGFGFALTGGSALLLAGLAPESRAALLQELFGSGEAAIHLSCLRLSIGASDLGPVAFSYCDLPSGQADPSLDSFDLDAGDRDLIPILREILRIRPGVKLIAAPWSAPPWMKTNGSFIAGSLKREYYAAYADYFVKYLQAMRQHGLHISAVTPQNEPHNPKNEPSMIMTAFEQAAFIKDHLGPALRRSCPETEILCWDHNCDEPDYPLAVLADPAARGFVSGVAWHLYAGKAEAMSDVQAKYPTMKTYFTEQWISATDDFAGALRWHIKNVVIGALRNSSRTILEWNLASDPGCALHTPQGAQGSLGGVTIGATIVRNAGYFVMAHSARFIPPGARRIHSEGPDQLPNVACLTPDGHVVLITINDSNRRTRFALKYGDGGAALELNPGAVATFRWPLEEDVGA